MPSMTPQSLLSELGASMGLPNLALDENGCARLIFDKRIEVNFENDPVTRRLQIYSVLGRVPAAEKEPLFELLLNANLFGTGTGDATLAVDSLEGDIVLCRTITGQDLPFSLFQSIVESFVGTAEKWIEKLSRQP